MWIPSAHHQQSPPHPGCAHGYKQKAFQQLSTLRPKPLGPSKASLQLFLLQSHNFVQCKNKRQKRLQHQLPTWVLAPSMPGSQQQQMMMMVMVMLINPIC